MCGLLQKFFNHAVQILWPIMTSVQRKHSELCQCVKRFASFVKCHVLDIMYVCDIHVFQGGYQIIWCDMGFLPIKFYFQEPIHQKRGIADQKVCFDPFREPVVYRTRVKACLHNPEAVFNLVSFMGYSQYVFCRVRKVCCHSIVPIILFFFCNLFSSRIYSTVAFSPDFVLETRFMNRLTSFGPFLISSGSFVSRSFFARSTCRLRTVL